MKWPSTPSATPVGQDMHNSPKSANGAGVIVSQDDLTELRRLAFAARKAEFAAAMTKAVAALPPEPEYRVIQGGDGMWRAERRELSAYPQSYELSMYSMKRNVPPEVGAISASWGWTPFAPSFETEAQAKKWLKDYLKPPTPKIVGFDAEGNEVPTTPPSA